MEGTSPATTVFIATGQDFPDALAAAAAVSGGRVLFTQRDSLPEVTSEELRRLQPHQTILVGGPAAVSDTVLGIIRSLGIGSVVRVGGRDRYETAVLLTRLSLPNPDTLPHDVRRLLALAVLVYPFATLLFVRFFMTSLSRQAALVETRALEARVPDHLPLHKLLVDLKTQLDTDRRQIRRFVLPGEKTLSKGDILAGWREFHAADSLWIATNAPPEEVSARVPTVVPGLQRIGQTAVAAAITSTQPARQRLAELRALVAEGLEHYYNDRDTHFENLAAADDKARWLTWAGVSLIALGGLMVGRESLFVLGAVGALLSRLFRIVKAPPVSTDYGASWSALFLAPILGALAGWGGTLVIHLLSQTSVNVLNSSLGTGWDHPLAATGLAVALVLGFSERLLPNVIGVAESSLSGPPSSPAGSDVVAKDGGGVGPPIPTVPTPTLPSQAAPAASLGTLAPSARVPGGTRFETVPDVAGTALPIAAAWLQALGFTVAVAGTGSSDTIAPGLALSTAPSAGTVLAAGGSVKLVVSSGPADRRT